MNKSHTVTLFRAALFLGVALSAAADAPQYIFVNKAPGIEWDAGRPESFTRAGFDELADAFPCDNEGPVRLGVSFVFDFFRYDIAAVEESLVRFLDLAAETGTPVLVNLDGQNWWGDRPDLWNWWDPGRPGFDPENVRNVEWYGWDASKAVKIGWRNWGSQIRVLPAMNLASPAVLEAHKEALGELLPVIEAWRDRLPPDRQWLLGGVKLGHEAGVGVNAFYYPDGNRYIEEYPDDPSHDPDYGYDRDKGWHGGLQPIGYAAVKQLGLKPSGDLTRDDIADVTHAYLQSLCEVAHECGLPRRLVFTHQGGTYAPWDKHVPFRAAFNDYSLSGYSFYWTDPAQAQGLGAELDRRGDARWAAVEWWWGGGNVEEWKDHFRRTLRFKDCRLLCIYNWNCGLSLKQDAAGRQALAEIVAETAKNRTGARP